MSKSITWQFGTISENKLFISTLSLWQLFKTFAVVKTFLEMVKFVDYENNVPENTNQCMKWNIIQLTYKWFKDAFSLSLNPF